MPIVFAKKGRIRNAQRTIVDGIKFHSKAEANRYVELKHLQSAGEISELTCQVPFKIHWPETDTLICTYIIDFTYYNGKTYPNYQGPIRVKILEEVKGWETPEYKLKEKMFLECLRNYPWPAQEVWEFLKTQAKDCY